MKKNMYIACLGIEVIAFEIFVSPGNLNGVCGLTFASN